MRNRKSIAVLGAALLTAGCATTPTGPMVRVMPAPNKPFEVFAQEQSDCEHYASVRSPAAPTPPTIGRSEQQLWARCWVSAWALRSEAAEQRRLAR